MDMPGARSAQRREIRRRTARGEPLVGLKVALLDSTAQQRLGTTEPVWGWLNGGMELADGGVVDCSSLKRRKGEVEVVFEMETDLRGPGVLPSDVWAATRALRVGLELPGSVRPHPPTDAADFVSDNTAAGNFVVGPPITDFAELDVPGLWTELTRDGEAVGRGRASRVLGDPARAVAWLANALNGEGEHIAAGMLVFSGSTTSPCIIEPGHLIGAEIERLGRLAVTTA